MNSFAYNKIIDVRLKINYAIFKAIEIYSKLVTLIYFNLVYPPRRDKNRIDRGICGSFVINSHVYW